MDLEAYQAWKSCDQKKLPPIHLVCESEMTFCFYFNPSKHSPISNVSVADRWTSWMVDLNVLNSFLQQGFEKGKCCYKVIIFLFNVPHWGAGHLFGLCRPLGEMLKWFFQALAVLNPHSCSIVFIHACVFALFRMLLLIGLLIKLMAGERSKRCQSFMTFIECIGNHMYRSGWS